MAIRLDDELHAQLVVVAQLDGQSVNDAIRVAVEAHIAARKPALSSRAEATLAEIEREAAGRRQAITTLFGDQPNEPAAAAARESGSRTGTGRGKEGGSTR
jgi:hypothetical protein